MLVNLFNYREVITIAKQKTWALVCVCVCVCVCTSNQANRPPPN